MWVMERLLSFATSTGPLTPVYLWDQCCHKKKKPLWKMQPGFQQAHPGQVPPDLILRTRAAGEYKDTPPHRSLSPRGFLGSMQTHVSTWTWLGSSIVLNPEAGTAALWGHGWPLIKSLSTMFFLWRCSLYSYLLYLSLSTFWLPGGSAALNAAPGHMLGFAFALCCAIPEAKSPSKGSRTAQTCMVVAPCKADEVKTC